MAVIQRLPGGVIVGEFCESGGNTHLFGGVDICPPRRKAAAPARSRPAAASGRESRDSLARRIRGGGRAGGTLGAITSAPAVAESAALPASRPVQGAESRASLASRLRGGRRAF